MIIFQIHTPALCRESESRLLFKAQLVPGSSFNQNTESYKYQPENKIEHDAFVENPAMAGAREVFNYFAERDNVTASDLQAYLAEKQKAGQLTPYEMSMGDHFNAINFPQENDTAKVAASQKEINNLLDYINSRNAVLKNQRRELRNFQMEGNEIPTVTGKVLGTAKDFLGEGVSRFQRADTAEKAVILGGIVSGFILLRFLYSKVGAGGKLKRAVGVVLGLALLGAAGETIVKTAGKLKESDEEWNAEKRAQEIAEIQAALKQTDVPDAFIKELSDNEQKVAAPVANLSTMRVEEFLDMYLASRGSKMIPDGDPLYPRRPIRKDGLLPAERFKVAEDVARTTGLVDQNGDVVPLPPERQGKSMLYLMLDWKHAPQQPAQSGTPQ